MIQEGALYQVGTGPGVSSESDAPSNNTRSFSRDTVCGKSSQALNWRTKLAEVLS